MRKIRRAFIALVCLLLAAAVLLFTLENKQPVELTFLSYTSPALPLAFTILAGFVLGAFFAGLTFWLPLGHYKRKTAKQAKKLAQLQEQLEEAKKETRQTAAGTEVVVAESAA